MHGETVKLRVLAFYNLHWQCNHSLHCLDHIPYLWRPRMCQRVTDLK